MKLQTLNKLRCIICKHQNLAYAGEIIENALVSGNLICPQCNATFPVINGIPRFIIKNEITKSPEISVFDKYTERYDSWFTSPKGKVLFQNEVEAIKELIRGIEIGESLEIGVGTGAFAKALRIPYGVDPAWNSLLLAKRRGVEVVQGIAENLPFKDNSFDTVFIIVTICYVKDPIKTLTETNRVLRNHGHVIIGFINKDSSWGREYLEKKKKGHIFYGPATFYSYQEVQGILERTGFKIQKVVSTLMQNPTEKPIREKPIVGFRAYAGFITILARKV